MTAVFPISLLRCTTSLSAGELAADVAGHEVFFRFRGLPMPIEPSGDPFAAAGVVKAMERHADMELGPGLPMSPVLACGLQLYQELYCRWFPEDITPVAIHAAESIERSAGEGVGCFFSGGIDSYFSYIRHSDRISHLVLVRGLDIPFAEVDRWKRTLAAAEAFAEAQCKALLVVETNVKEVLQSELHENFGAILISTALAAGLRELIVPASYDFRETHPSGSHAATDPLVATDRTRVFHDGAVPRVAKVAAIVAAGIDLSTLRVCNRQTEYNCGQCEKCLRTLVALDLLGAASSALPGPLDLRQLERVEVWDDRKLPLWIENRNLALSIGRIDVVVACDAILRRNARRALWHRLDDRLLGGRIGRHRSTRRGRAG